MKKRFLLIDDNPIDIIVNKRIIELADLQTTIKTFNSGKAALAYIKEATQGELPEIILLDILMPEMNGFEFMEQFALLPINIKEKMNVFLLSSTIDPGDIQLANNNPDVIALLSKPLQSEALKKYLATN